jgi:hypothetical protein
MLGFATLHDADHSITQAPLHDPQRFTSLRRSRPFGVVAERLQISIAERLTMLYMLKLTNMKEEY